MTIRECRKFQKASKCAKFIRKHINRRLGEMIQDQIDDRWERRL